MSVQRLLSALVWYALAAATAVLLFPSLFPDIHLPAVLAASPNLRNLVTLALSLVVVVGAGQLLLGALRPRRRPARPAALASIGGPVAAPIAPASPSTPTAPVAAPPPTPVALVAPSPAPAGPDRARLLQLVEQAQAARAAGHTEEATELHEAAVAEARALYATHTDVEATTDLADALAEVAGLEDAEGRVEAALAPYEESLALYRQAAGAAPEDRKVAFGLFTALCRLADCREARGHRSRAHSLYGEAVSIIERLAWLEPASAEYSQALASARERRDVLSAELAPDTDGPQAED